MLSTFSFSNSFVADKAYLSFFGCLEQFFNAGKMRSIINLALPGFPWVADLLMSFPEGTNEGYGPIFSDSGADRALVC